MVGPRQTDSGFSFEHVIQNSTVQDSMWRRLALAWFAWRQSLHSDRPKRPNHHGRNLASGNRNNLVLVTHTH
jgi:hypothetical protein